MIARSRRIFARYVAQHLGATATGIPLTTPEGELFGYVDRLHYRGGHVSLDGWSAYEGLTLFAGGRPCPLQRRLLRADVAHAYPDVAAREGTQLGFAGDAAWTGGPVKLMAEVPGARGQKRRLHIALPVPDQTQLDRARRRALAAFSTTAIRALPVALRYVVGGRDPATRERLRALFGIKHQPGAGRRRLEEAMFASQDPSPQVRTPVSIVLPVYNAFDLTREALRRVEAHTDVPWHLYIVEDCSTDARVRPWLVEWAADRPDRVTLLPNERNLGFVGSVNRALKAAGTERPVVLLNSDALVPRGWASRLLAPMVADASIASVTPMSNEATILTVPAISGEVSIADGTGDRIDEVARKLSADNMAEVPAGVGFCMALAPQALRLVPQFDSAFGRGYGEEVDWCQRLRAEGMRHVGIGNLFVEHRGGQSFGSEAKQRIIAAHGRIISDRYPGFDADVQRFIAADPLLPARVALALGWVAAEHPDAAIHVGHSLGGGAETYLASRIAAQQAAGIPAVILRLGGVARFGVELHWRGAVQRVATDSPAMLLRLLEPLRGNPLVYSCGVGDPCGIELPDLLMQIAGSGPIEVLFHDYWMVSPSHGLVDSDGCYRGLPDPETTDPVHLPRLADGGRGTLRDWQAAWGRFLLAATRIVTFSANSAGMVRSVWPEVADRIQVAPHSLPHRVPAIDASPWAGDRPGTLGILGAIGSHKGAQFVSDLARWCADRPDAPRIVIIGEFDLAFPLPASVIVTGRYRVGDLPTLIARHRIQAWLMPSIVPETFSFTTHEMLATGLPVFAFDLGAQGDAVRAAPNGVILADSAPATLVAAFQEVMADIRSA